MGFIIVLIFEIEGRQSYQWQILNLAQPKDEKLQNLFWYLNSIHFSD